MIDVKNISMRYGGIAALDGVSWKAAAGEVIGLLGPNGAGKTTMMRILTGYMEPTAGRVSIAGIDMLSRTIEAQRHIGYLPENNPLYPELTVAASLAMTAELRQLPASSKQAALAAVVDELGLAERLHHPVATLSKGYCQRLGLAQAILHKPAVLILDEPTNGLDPGQTLEMRRLIRRLAATSTVMVSSHILSEVEATCDRVIILMRGKIMADARLADLAACSDLRIAVDTAGEDPIALLASIAGVRTVQSTGREDFVSVLRIEADKGSRPGPEIFRLARDRGWTLHEMSRLSRTLESIFTELELQQGAAQ